MTCPRYVPRAPTRRELRIEQSKGRARAASLVVVDGERRPDGMDRRRRVNQAATTTTLMIVLAVTTPSSLPAGRRNKSERAGPATATGAGVARSADGDVMRFAGADETAGGGLQVCGW
jgi:hypothetical protein